MQLRLCSSALLAMLEIKFLHLFIISELCSTDVDHATYSLFCIYHLMCENKRKD